MRSLRGGLVCAAVLSTACHAGIRQTAGTTSLPKGATSLGAQRGMTRSVTMGDEGGLLTMAAVKAGLLGFGLMGAFGSASYSEYKTETYVKEDPYGNVTATTYTEGTAKVDTKAAQSSVDLINAHPSFRRGHGSLAANLEIASTALGGDTSGYQFQFGYAYRLMQSRGRFLVRARGWAGMGFGHWTYHDRESRLDRGPPTFEDYRFGFAGVPLKVAAMIGTRRRDGLALVPEYGVEPYIGTEINFYSDPTPLRVGARLIVKYVHVDVEWATSSEGDSVSLELGGGI